MPRLPPTERLHPKSKGLDALPVRRALAVLHEGDVEATRAVGRALPALARLATLAAGALRSGGRVVYVGAGTSGRLGALDAAEWPPTFGVAPSRAFAIVAGGARALRRAVEGAEDDTAAGRTEIRRAGVGARDLVVGITASGTTPYVLAALGEARARGAATGLVTSNPSARSPGAVRAVLATGPELVAGSTRMKAGAATKMALSLLSTAAMLELGKVVDGRMIDLAPTSTKLRLRATRMVMELARATAADARAALEASGWRVRQAARMLEAWSGSRSGAASRSRSRSRSNA